MREPFYIARGVMLDAGANDLQATATDTSNNESTVPVSPDDHEVTLDNTVNVTYTYDNAGCLSSDGTSTYHYDDEHRLIEVTQGETTVAAYTYDALGRRLTKTVGATEMRYIYDGQSVIEEYKDVSGPGRSTPNMSTAEFHSA